MQLIETQCLVWEWLYMSCKYSHYKCSVHRLCSGGMTGFFLAVKKTRSPHEPWRPGWTRDAVSSHTSSTQMFCTQINNTCTFLFLLWYCSINGSRFKQWTGLLLLEKPALHHHLSYLVLHVWHMLCTKLRSETVKSAFQCVTLPVAPDWKLQYFFTLLKVSCFKMLWKRNTCPFYLTCYDNPH